MRPPPPSHAGTKKRRPLAGPSGWSYDRRGWPKDNQNPTGYVPRSWPSYEEKETDVNIAVSIVADAAAASSDLALIISADSDLCPAIRTARSLNSRRGMIAAFPPRRSSFEIRSLIRGAFTVAAVDLRNSLLPEAVRDPATSRTYRRPGKWR